MDDLQEREEGVFYVDQEDEEVGSENGAIAATDC
jgi:hypothetical protein